MTYLRTAVSFLLLVSLVGCASSRISVASDANFSAYRYVFVSDSSFSDDEFGLEVETGNLFTEFGYRVIGESDVYPLSLRAKKEILFVRTNMDSSPDQSICTIEIEDFSTGRTLLTAKGMFGMGWNMDGDRSGAMERALKQVREALKDSSK